MRFRREEDTVSFDDGGMNLLSSAALRELRDVIDDCRADGRMLVFGSGRDHIFAAGADMTEMANFAAADARAFARLGQETFDAIERLPFVTVAIIDGDCFGGALDLVLSFDLRFATPRARFAHPGARLGIVTGFGGTSRWRKALTPPAARRLFLANEILSAADAQALGLVDRVAESFDDELARLAALDPTTTRFVKELARASDRISPSQVALLGGRLGAIYF